MANPAVECSLCLQKNFAFLCTFDKSCNCAMIICDACLPVAMKFGKCLSCAAVLHTGHIDKHLTISELDKTNPYYCPQCLAHIVRAKLSEHRIKCNPELQPLPLKESKEQFEQSKEKIERSETQIKKREIMPEKNVKQKNDADVIWADNLTEKELFRILSKKYPISFHKAEDSPLDGLKQIWKDIKNAFKN